MTLAVKIFLNKIKSEFRLVSRIIELHIALPNSDEIRNIKNTAFEVLDFLFSVYKTRGTGIYATVSIVV